MQTPPVASRFHRCSGLRWLGLHRTLHSRGTPIQRGRARCACLSQGAMAQRAAWCLGLFGLQGWHGVFLLGASHRNSTVEGSRKNRARGEAPPPLAARATRETSFVSSARGVQTASAKLLSTPRFMCRHTSFPHARHLSSRNPFHTHEGTPGSRVKALLMTQDLAETPTSICQLAAVPCSTSCVRSARRGPHRRFPAHRTAQTLFSPVRGAGVPQPLVAGGS